MEGESDYKRVRLRDESSADSWLVPDTAAKMIHAGATHVRVTQDEDGDWIIEGWK